MGLSGYLISSLHGAVPSGTPDARIQVTALRNPSNLTTLYLFFKPKFRSPSSNRLDHVTHTPQGFRCILPVLALNSSHVEWDNTTIDVVFQKQSSRTFRSIHFLVDQSTRVPPSIVPASSDLISLRHAPSSVTTLCLHPDGVVVRRARPKCGEGEGERKRWHAVMRRER